GEIQSTGAELVSEQRKLLECLGDPQLLLCDLPAVAEHPLGVLVKGAKTETDVRAFAKCCEQPASFLVIETCAMLREPDELRVRPLPCRLELRTSTSWDGPNASAVLIQAGTPTR
ncbi:MAG TPA: hypothetical protein VGK73_35060, partial [Polyangiaceae bacterium]